MSDFRQIYCNLLILRKNAAFHMAMTADAECSIIPDDLQTAPAM